MFLFSIFAKGWVVSAFLYVGKWFMKYSWNFLYHMSRCFVNFLTICDIFKFLKIPKDKDDFWKFSFFCISCMKILLILPICFQTHINTRQICSIKSYLRQLSTLSGWSGNFTHDAGFLIFIPGFCDPKILYSLKYLNVGWFLVKVSIRLFLNLGIWEINSLKFHGSCTEFRKEEVS